MTVEHINYSDTLRQGTDKINAVIDQSNEAMAQSSEAKTMADEAKNLANNIQDQLNQVVIEGDSSVEAAQARVNADGYAYATLKERLDNSDAQLAAKVNSNDLKVFNLQDYSPAYITDLSLSLTAASQCTAQKGNYLYTCQDNGLTSPQGNKCYVITRTDLAGNFIDSMTVNNGGHGSGIGVEVENGTTYIWSNMFDSNKVSKLVRFPYQPNTTIDGTEATTIYYQSFTTDYTYPFVNQEDDIIILKRNPSGSNSVVEVRKLSDIKMGINNILYSYTLSAEQHDSYQSLALLDKRYLYFLMGLAPSANKYAGIHCVDLTTGEIISRYDGYVGENGSGNFEYDFVEMESIFIYVDKDTNDKGLFIVVNTGTNDYALSKKYNLIAFAPKSIRDKFTGYVLRNTPKVSLYDRNGAVKRVDVSKFNSLADITEPGYYYLNGDEFNQLADAQLQKFNISSGGFLSIKRSNLIPAVCLQAIEYNSTVNHCILQRIVRLDGTVTDWNHVNNVRIPLKAGVDILTLPPGRYEGAQCINIPITDDVSWYEFDITVGQSGRKQIEATISANGRRFIRTIHTGGTGGSTGSTGLATGWKEYSFLT